MLFLKNKVGLLILGCIIIYSCNHYSKKQQKPESQINRKADSLLLICLNILDTTEHKYQYDGHPMYEPVFMKNYLQHETDTTIPLRPWCIISYDPIIGYDSTNFSAFFTRSEFDKYNADTAYKEINTSIVHYFNFVSIDSIRAWQKKIKLAPKGFLMFYSLSKPILSDNGKYIYLEFTDNFISTSNSGWYCIFEKNKNGGWFLKKMECRWIV